MVCPRCKATINDDRSTCPFCGAAVAANSPRSGGLSRDSKIAIGFTLGCFGFLCLLCTVALVFATVPDLVGLPLSIVAAAVPAFLYSVAVIWLDRYEREPASVLLGTFFWGSVVAVVLAILLELFGSVMVAAVAGQELADVAVSVVGAPLAEEASKGLVLLVLFFLLKNEFDDTLDGIIYGSLVGLGFAMTENVLYFGGEYMEGGVGSLAELFVIRAVLSGLGHALYTGTIGAGLGFARETTSNVLKVVAPLGAFALGIGQHFLWNGILQVLGTLLPNTDSFLALAAIVAAMTVVLSGPVFLVLLTIIFLTWRREQRVITEHLASEVESGVVTAEEYAILSSSWRRTGTLYGALANRGPGYWYHLRKLFDAEVELAFAKWRESRGNRPRRTLSSSSQGQQRVQIAEIRSRLSGL